MTQFANGQEPTSSVRLRLSRSEHRSLPCGGSTAGMSSIQVQSFCPSRRLSITGARVISCVTSLSTKGFSQRASKTRFILRVSLQTPLLHYPGSVPQATRLKLFVIFGKSRWTLSRILLSFLLTTRYVMAASIANTLHDTDGSSTPIAEARKRMTL